MPYCWQNSYALMLGHPSASLFTNLSTLLLRGPSDLLLRNPNALLLKKCFKEPSDLFWETFMPYRWEPRMPYYWKILPPFYWKALMPYCWKTLVPYCWETLLPLLWRNPKALLSQLLPSMFLRSCLNWPRPCILHLKSVEYYFGFQLNYLAYRR